jgi:hypothetical protein
MMGDFNVASLNRRHSLTMPKIKKCGFNEQRDADKSPAVFVTSVAFAVKLIHTCLPTSHFSNVIIEFF